MERKEYKRYSRDFKLEAVRLAALREKPKAQLLASSGSESISCVSGGWISNWRSARVHQSRWPARTMMREVFGVRSYDCGRRSRF
jgi:transposase-like protein